MSEINGWGFAYGGGLGFGDIGVCGGLRLWFDMVGFGNCRDKVLFSWISSSPFPLFWLWFRKYLGFVEWLFKIVTLVGRKRKQISGCYEFLWLRICVKEIFVLW